MTDLAAQGTAASAASFEACANALPTESCANFLGENPVAACAPLAGSVATGAAVPHELAMREHILRAPFDLDVRRLRERASSGRLVQRGCRLRRPQ